MANRPLFNRCTSVEDAAQETPVLRGSQPDPRFALLVDAFKMKDMRAVQIHLLKGLSVNYREPARGNRTLLIYAVKHDFFEAVVKLVSIGANVGIGDAAGVTPLHMAAGGGHLATVRLLLVNKAPIDALDAHSRTPLHYAARAVNQDPSSGGAIAVVEALLSAGALRGRKDGEGRLPLHNAATAGSATLIKILVGNRSKVTLNINDNEGRTPLHCAVQGARSLDAVAVLLQLGCSVDTQDAQGNSALHLVAARPINHVDDEFDGACLELLLSHGASVAVKNSDGYNALSLALRRTMWWGRPGARDYVLHTVQQLVSKGSSIQDGFAMWRMVESFPSLVPAALNRSILANTSARDSPHLRLDFDFGPLNVNTKQLHDIQRQSPLNPQSELPPPLLKDTEVAMLHYILWSGRKGLLRHPLCHSFLHLKWYKVRRYFLANVTFYFLFVLSLTAFLLASHNCPYNSTNINDTSNHINVMTVLNNSDVYLTMSSHSGSESRQTVQPCHWSGKEAGIVGLSWWCLVIFCALLNLREFVQVIQNPMIYIHSIGNILDLALVVCVPQLLVSMSAESPNSTMTCCLAVWQQRVGAIAIILAWVRLMLFTGQFPICGVYIIMFSTVAKNVLKFLAMYVFVLIAFALGFYVLLRTHPTFSNPATSFTTSLVMMTGELDYEATFLETPSQSPVLCIFILVVFIVLVYIILSNLLVGLAVSDMYAIQQRSEILRLTRHVELMIQVEALFRSRFVPKRLQELLLSSIKISGNQPITSVFPNCSRGFTDALFLMLTWTFGSRKVLIKLFEVFVSGFIPPEDEPPLPSQLVNEAVNIGLREHELDKRDRLLHLRALQHKHGQLVQSLSNQTTVMRRSSWLRPTNVGGVRASWRLTMTSDTDTEDDMGDLSHQQLQPQTSMCHSSLPYQVQPQRAVASDPNMRLEELHNVVLSLQASVEALRITVQQQQLPHNAQSIAHTAITIDSSTTESVNV